MAESSTYYDVLNVPQTADQTTIRKAYLRASLACHPDKNPGNEAAAKAKFIEIGEAYNVLRDPSSRASYDRELAAGKWRERRRHRTKNNNAPGAQTNATNDAQTEQEFKNFMDMFDSTVAGMSPEELNAAMGAAAIVGSVIGSLLGARAGKNSLVSSAASLVGSAMASRAAASLVQTVHEDSTKRMVEKEEREAKIARGEKVEEPTPSDSRERLMKDALGAVQKMAAAAAAFATPLSEDGSGQHAGYTQPNNSQFQRNMTFGNNGSIRFSFGNGARSSVPRRNR